MLLSMSCNENSKAKFSLIGNTNGIADGTILYLDSNLANEVIDSAVVENNYFKFQTKLMSGVFMSRSLLKLFLIISIVAFFSISAMSCCKVCAKLAISF